MSKNIKKKKNTQLSMKGNLDDLVVVDTANDNWILKLLGTGRINKAKKLEAYMQNGPVSSDPPLLYFDNGGILSHNKTEYNEEGEGLFSWQHYGSRYQHDLSGIFYIHALPQVADPKALFRFEIIIIDATPFLESDKVLQMRHEIGLALYTKFRTSFFPRFGYNFKEGLRK